MAFYFAKPADLQFTAGQFVDLTLLDPPVVDSAGASRTMTIASAPFEDHLMFAMRMRDSAFKRVMRGLPAGCEVIIDDPAGAFTLHKNPSKPAVFIAGGIGITPFLSILREAAHEGLPHRFFLFFSNRRPEDAAFLSELQTMATKYPNLRFIPTMTRMWQSGQKWESQIGYIDIGMLSGYIGSLVGPIYYVAGPPAMIESMRQRLLENGVARDDINADPFDGY